LPPALAQLAIKIDAIRLLFVGWCPRPALVSDEVEGRLSALNKAIERHVNHIFAEFVRRRATAVDHFHMDLQAWYRMSQANFDDTDRSLATRP
jgi:hypothetical protein